MKMNTNPANALRPLVTIGIPCYNGARWLRAAVKSAIQQTWANTEIIVVDDGSTDDSLAIAREFDGAIRIESIPNSGVNRARNLILERARGEWIQYLDADDYLLPEKIECQLTEASPVEDCDIIYSPILCENWLCGVPQPCVIGEVNQQQDVCWQLLAWQLPQTGGALWRKSLIEKIGGWDENPERLCDEHELYVRAIKAAARFRFVPTSGAVYRIWSDDTRCRRNPCAVIHCRTNIVESLRKWMCSRNSWSESHRAIAAQGFFEMARMYAKYDLVGATEYHRARKNDGLIEVAGQAAPCAYRAVYKTLGFLRAEKLARFLRRRTQKAQDATGEDTCGKH